MRRPSANAVESHIVLPRSIVVADIRHIFGQCEHLVDFRGYSDLHIDASAVELAFPEAMLPLASLMQRYREDGVRVHLTLPRFRTTAQLWVNCNWAHIIDPTFPTSERDNGRDLPAQVFDTGPTQFQLVNRAIDRVLRTTTQLERAHLSALEWALNEITDNVLVHSVSTDRDIANQRIGAGLMQVSIRRRLQEIEFVVADSGFGIPHSLRTCLNPHLDDRSALTEAIKEGVTRGTGMGNGLYGSYQICATSGGAFTINSGKAFLAWLRSGEVLVRPETRPFPGTAITAVICYAQPLVLERALQFKGRPHTPVDVIETTYEADDEGVIVFPLANEAEALGSRRCALDVRTKLQNLITMAKATRAVIDMTDVPLLSSSFADEVFGKMALVLGREDFEQQVVFRACSETNRALIARAVDARLAQAAAKRTRVQ